MNAKDLLDRKSFCTLLDCLVNSPQAEELQAVLNYYEGVRVQGNQFHMDKPVGRGLEAVIPIPVKPKTKDIIEAQTLEAPKKRRGRTPGSKNKPKVKLTGAQLKELASSDDTEEIEGAHVAKKVDADQVGRPTQEAVIMRVIEKHVKGQRGRQFAIPERLGELTVSLSNKTWEACLKAAGIGFNKLDWAYIEEHWRGPVAGPGTGYMPLTLS